MQITPRTNYYHLSTLGLQVREVGASMAPKNRHRQSKGDNSIVQNGSRNVYANGQAVKDEDSASRKPVLDTPFSVDMFQVMSKHPHDDSTLPPKMNTVVHIRPEAIWASLSKYNSFISTLPPPNLHLREHRAKTNKVQYETTDTPSTTTRSSHVSSHYQSCTTPLITIPESVVQHAYWRSALTTPRMSTSGSIGFIRPINSAVVASLTMEKMSSLSPIIWR